MIIRNQLRDLTRKIVLGATIGGAPLLTVGCAVPAPEAQPAMAAPQMTEKQQVAQVLASRDPQAVEAFLAAHPTGRYSVSLLNALPPSVLVQISRPVVESLPPQTVRHLTRRTRAALARSFNEGGDAAAPAMEQTQPTGEPPSFPSSSSPNPNIGGRSGY